jgi:hypothetical protein
LFKDEEKRVSRRSLRIERNEKIKNKKRNIKEDENKRES